MQHSIVAPLYRFTVAHTHVPLARAAMLPCLVCLHVPCRCVHVGALFAAVTQFSRSARLVNSIDGSALNLQQLPHWRCMPRKFTGKFMHYLHIVYFRVSFSFNIFHFVFGYLWQRNAKATHSCPGLAKSRLSCGAPSRIDMLTRPLAKRQNRLFFAEPSSKWQVASS